MAITYKQNALGKMWCSMFGHQFVKTRNVTGHFKEYQCPVCRLEQTNDAKGERIFMTPELKDINETLMHLYQKRHPAI
ncbi:MAG TPA: hypothetical protein PLS51_06295 [Flavobacterium sp.]|nr:hypothetical protein [Flavobacterium sp.]HPJ10222.1 hypothetical protein [Flavobacterium sp.]